MNAINRHRRSGNAGFTLIEVMIALAVLTIGLTGLAVMQLSSMQFSHSSHYRSLASTVALNIEEQLWLELADNDFDCGSDWDGMVTDHQTSWARTYLDDAEEDRSLLIPGLQINLNDDDPPVVDGTVVKIPIVLSWTETRFGDTDGANTESFDYTIQIQCTSA
ncbi:MAG TPA: type IV pilus modification protein PilV [Xanthomonadales bacterium]|nr:type IV pilus modification protein PilV [Xanthomonadales bacterium]